MVETWKPIPSLPGYTASSLGRIRGPRTIRIPQKRPDGYYHITLVNPRTKKRGNFLTHRLICEAFHGPPPFEGALALHGDHDRDNCREDNLHWGTHLENQEEKALSGRAYQPEGVLNPRAKLTAVQVDEIKEKAINTSGKVLAKEYGISYSMCRKIIRGRHWNGVPKEALD